MSAGAVLAADLSTKRKRLDTITAVYFGLIIGVVLTYVFTLALTPIMPATNPQLANWLRLALATVLCYTCISVLLQTKDDFRFIIPYVEFAKEVKGLKPYVLDTSVVIDGRIADVVETRIIDNQLVMPQFVIAELQAIADSGDKLRRNRGRRGLDRIDGIDRIRFTSPHPKDFRDPVIAAMAECDSVCEHIHLPLQSGSTRVLKAMRRTYGRDRYLALVDKLRAAIPDLALTTDIIVGFPGETDEDFAQTVDVVREVGYDGAFTFVFSPRSGTEAATMADQVPPWPSEIV